LHFIPGLKRNNPMQLIPDETLNSNNRGKSPLIFASAVSHAIRMPESSGWL